jgi:drug/metabolite transporter superfamily protein YnfA
MKKPTLIMGAFVAFLLIIWGALIMHSQYASDPVFEAIGGVFVAIGLTFFWAVHKT